MENTTIMIGGVEYTPKHSTDSEIKIVVLQRSWVMVGYWQRTESDCRLENACVIRRWGTSHGLGELVNGPLPNTVLDPTGTVYFDYLTVVCAIDCKKEKWEKEL